MPFTTNTLQDSSQRLCCNDFSTMYSTAQLKKNYKYAYWKPLQTCRSLEVQRSLCICFDVYLQFHCLGLYITQMWKKKIVDLYSENQFAYNTCRYTYNSGGKLYMFSYQDKMKVNWIILRSCRNALSLKVTGMRSLNTFLLHPLGRLDVQYLHTN